MPQRRAQGIPWVMLVIPNKIPTCHFQLFSNECLAGVSILPGEMKERELLGKSLCYYVVWLRVTALWKQLMRIAIITTTKNVEQLWAVSDYYWVAMTGHYLHACIYNIYIHIMYLWITLANSRWLMEKLTKITERWWSIMLISWKDYYLPAIKIELLINIIYYSENLIFFILTSKRFSRNSQNCCRWVLHQHRRQSCWCTYCCCCWFKLLLL